MSFTHTGTWAGRWLYRIPTRAMLLTILLAAIPHSVWGQSIQAGDSSIRLVSVRPTVLFSRGKDGLTQAVEIAVENKGDSVQPTVDVRIGAARRSEALGVIQPGKSSLRFHVPDVRESASAEFVLRAGDRVLATHRMPWQPRKHWTVYFVPITHHDLGYTDTIENVLNLYAGFYDDVLRFCDQTSDWPDEAKYRYTLEGTWSLQHFMENRPKENTRQ